MHVTLRSYAFLTGILFALIGLIKAIFLFYGWSISIGSFIVPDWLNWLSLILCVLIAWEAIKLSGHGK